MDECPICGNPQDGVRVCGECVKDYHKTPEGREKQLGYSLKKEYNMTTADYYTILEKQEGKCAICGQAPELRRLSVDHSHETGRIRGLLCHLCNVMLGFARDSREILRAADKYLE